MPNTAASPKRILHIHYGKEGGAERFLVTLAQGFAEEGVEQRFLIRPNRSWRDEVAAFGQAKEFHYPRFWPIRKVLQRWVDAQVRDWKPDAVIAWMSKASTLLPEANGPAKFVRLGDYPRHIDHFKHATCMITNTPDISNRLKTLGWTGAVEVISNFTRTSETEANRVLFDLPKDHFILCAAGRFVGLKGFDSLIRAVAQTEGTSLCLVGDGEERPALEALARNLGIAERVQMTGWVSDPTRWLASSDLVCVTSTHEPLGNVVLEAWNCRVPVISTPSAGPSWLIKDGETGILLEDFAPETLAAGITRARLDPSLCATMVKNGAAKLEAEFSQKAIVAAYFKAIEKHRAGQPRAR